MIRNLVLTAAVLCGLAGAALATMNAAVACPGASNTTASNNTAHFHGT